MKKLFFILGCGVILLSCKESKEAVVTPEKPVYIDVTSLEGDGNNPMFFSVSKLPEKLSFGKHYFHLSLIEKPGQEYILRPGSRILFEFKSSNNVILRSDIVRQGDTIDL